MDNSTNREHRENNHAIVELGLASKELGRLSIRSFAWTSVALFLALLAVVAGTFYAVTQTQESSQRWCDVLTVLTSHPVPAPPSGSHTAQATNYRLYQDFVQLSKEFGCHTK